MNTGVVKWFSNQKGYGFIEQDNGGDIFVHYSEIVDQDGFKTLNEGDRVTFEVGQGEKGPAARSTQLCLPHASLRAGGRPR